MRFFATRPGRLTGCLTDRPLKITDDAGDQARHLHLRDAEDLADLPLSTPAHEAQFENLPVPTAQSKVRPCEDRAHLGGKEPLVGTTERLFEGQALTERAGRVQRRGDEAPVEAARLFDAR